MASRVFRTMRSSVPCRMSDLLSATVAPVGWLEESSAVPVGRKEERRSSMRLRYLWPLRVPIVSGAVLVLLPFIAFADGVRPFLSGLFDPVEPVAIILITALALLNAWAVLMIACLVMTYGAARFGLPPRPCVVPPRN